MKVEQGKEKKFEPITITLETEEEAQKLTAIMNDVRGEGSLWMFSYFLWRRLDELYIDYGEFRSQIKTSMICNKKE